MDWGAGTHWRGKGTFGTRHYSLHYIHLNTANFYNVGLKWTVTDARNDKRPSSRQVSRTIESSASEDDQESEQRH